MPISGGLSLASELPPGSIPTLAPASAYQAQGDLLLLNMLVADGTVADTTAAQAYVATQTDAQIAAYLRSKTPNELLTTVLTRLAPIGASGAGPIPEGTVLPVDPIAEIHAGHYLKVPVLAGNTRDEGKLFPSFLALSPALGGVSGRLLTDAQVFSMAFSYDPNAAPQTTVEQWIPAVYLPTDTPVTGFTARAELLNQIFFGASRDQHAERPEDAAGRRSGTTASTGTRSRRRSTRSTARRTPSTCRSCSATSGRRCWRTSPTPPPTGRAGSTSPTR